MPFSFLLAFWVAVCKIKTQSVQPFYLKSFEWLDAWLDCVTTGSCSGLSIAGFSVKLPVSFMRSLKQIFMLVWGRFFGLLFLLFPPWNAKSLGISSKGLVFACLMLIYTLSVSSLPVLSTRKASGQVVCVCELWWALVQKLFLLRTNCFEVMKDFVNVLSCVLWNLCILVTTVIIFTNSCIAKVPWDGKDLLSNCAEKLLTKQRISVLLHTCAVVSEAFMLWTVTVHINSQLSNES